MGAHFTVETDHKALPFINSASHLTGCHAYWALLLQEYDFSVKYCPGSRNSNADALSRLMPTDAALPSIGGEDVVPCPNTQYKHYYH